MLGVLLSNGSVRGGGGLVTPVVMVVVGDVSLRQIPTNTDAYCVST